MTIEFIATTLPSSVEGFQIIQDRVGNNDTDTFKVAHYTNDVRVEQSRIFLSLLGKSYQFAASEVVVNATIDQNEDLAVLVARLRELFVAAPPQPVIENNIITNNLTGTTAILIQAIDFKVAASTDLLVNATGNPFYITSITVYPNTSTGVVAEDGEFTVGILTPDDTVGVLGITDGLNTLFSTPSGKGVVADGETISLTVSQAETTADALLMDVVLVGSYQTIGG